MHVVVMVGMWLCGTFVGYAVATAVHAGCGG